MIVLIISWIEKTYKYFGIFSEEVITDILDLIGEKPELWRSIFTALLFFTSLWVLYVLIGAAKKLINHTINEIIPSAKGLIRSLYMPFLMVLRLRFWGILLVLVLIMFSVWGADRVVTHIEQAGIEELIKLERPEVARAEDAVLTWKPAKALSGTRVSYQAQWALDDKFKKISSDEPEETTDTILRLDGKDQTRFWRVRVLLRRDNKLIRRGQWSDGYRVDQYVNTLERLKKTKILRVAMEHSYGRSMFRYLASPADKRSGGATSHRGVEPELAYKIADKVCSKIFDIEKCLSPAKICLDDEKCITVQFVEVGWDEIFKGFARDEYDIVLASTTYMTERMGKYNIAFSNENYDENGYALILRQDRDTPPSQKVLAAGMLRGEYNNKNTKDVRILVEGDTTSEYCITFSYNKIKEEIEETTSIQASRKSLEGVKSILEPDGPDFLVTASRHAEGLSLKYGSKLKIIPLPTSFFGPTAPTYCKASEYRAVLHVGDAAFKDIIDEVFKNKDYLKCLKADENKNFCKHLYNTYEVKNLYNRFIKEHSYDRCVKAGEVFAQPQQTPERCRVVNR